jgi:predicted transposase/invertase (TIGR01784 family)
LKPNVAANANFKDSVFTKLFSETDKIIKMYNALSQSQYPLDTPIEITTLEDVFYKGRYNDLSFIVDGKIVVMVKHQSTISPNLPIRLMIYLGKVYDSCMKKQNVYSSRLIKVPRPEFIVLYNGKDDYPDESILRLSDAFFDLPEGHNSSGSLELTARVLNINKGHNQAAVQQSDELDGYVVLVDEIRKNKDSGMTLEEAVAKAVRDCADRNVLADFLEKYGSEVVNMLYAEFNVEEYGRTQREEGKTEGVLETAISMLKEGLKPETVAKCTGVPLESVYQLQPQ